MTTAGRWALPLCFVFACAHRAAPIAPAPAATPPPDAGNAVANTALAGDAGALAFATLPPDSDSDADAGEEEEEGGPEGEGAPDMERESHAVAAPGTDAGPRYTTDLSDDELARRWKDELPSLGSISLGFADEGRMINSAPFPEGEDHLLVSPDKAFGTTETIEQTLAAIRRVRELHPRCPPLRINNVSGKEGGYLRPHHSHQSGRDVDLGFYYPTVEPIRERMREKVIDVAMNWELVKALATRTDVELILVDRRVQKVLYDYALAAGEDKVWLDSLFHAGMSSLLFHARGHRDHFHVRFYNPRAQELGRRVAPLLAQRPDENRAFHRVRQGDTLGALARHYGSSVAGIQKVNHLKGTMLHLSQLLQIPLRGPCTQCPIPAPVVVPPRRLSPPRVNAGSPPTVEPQPPPASAPPPQPAAPLPEGHPPAPKGPTARVPTSTLGPLVAAGPGALLPALDLHSAFEVQALPEDGKLYRTRKTRAGTLSLPSGTVAAFDPLSPLSTTPYGRAVTPGRYPVELLELVDEQRFALARVVFAPGTPAKWELVTDFKVGDFGRPSVPDDPPFRRAWAKRQFARLSGKDPLAFEAVSELIGLEEDAAEIVPEAIAQLRARQGDPQAAFLWVTLARGLARQEAFQPPIAAWLAQAPADVIDGFVLNHRIPRMEPGFARAFAQAVSRPSGIPTWQKVNEIETLEKGREAFVPWLRQLASGRGEDAEAAQRVLKRWNAPGR